MNLSILWWGVETVLGIGNICKGPGMREQWAQPLPSCQSFLLPQVELLFPCPVCARAHGRAHTHTHTHTHTSRGPVGHMEDFTGLQRPEDKTERRLVSTPVARHEIYTIILYNKYKVLIR